MKIVVGSKNPIKIDAVIETVTNYHDLFGDSLIIPLDIPSGVSNQPKSLEETIQGAIRRSVEAIAEIPDANYSFGIESGLMKVPLIRTGYMDFCACSIYDGFNTHLGLSSAFEFPKEVNKLIFQENLDANQAFFKLGLTEDKNIGSGIGTVGYLTKGRITRKDYTMQAIQMAIIQLENKELY